MAASLERIDPDAISAAETTGADTLQLHLERYRFAGAHLRPGRVADVACGVGYGSYLLATEFGAKISGIIAADIDESSIQRAVKRYAHPSIEFVVKNALEFSAPAPLDNIVSLETIEHLPDPRSFVRHLGGQMVRGGRFIASAPITPSMDANPYHLSDFTASSFRKLFDDSGFREIDSLIQMQPYNPFKIVGRQEERSKDLRTNLPGYYLQNPAKLFLRLKSLATDGFTNKYLVGVFEKM
jgi:cyclopropane fatty-acyl-phospholipid synthase-like methyltransferase